MRRQWIVGARHAGAAGDLVKASILLLLLALAPPPATAPDWVLENRAYEAFLTDLQTAVKSDDRRAVANLIDFPLRVNGPNGRTRYYRDAHSVRVAYSQIFTPQIRRAIASQRFTALFGSYQGVMIGGGEVWFDHTCPNDTCTPRGPVRIRAINR